MGQATSQIRQARQMHRARPMRQPSQTRPPSLMQRVGGVFACLGVARAAFARLFLIVRCTALILLVACGPAFAADAVKLFGTVEFKGPLKGLPTWLGVMERNGKNPVTVNNFRLNTSTTWDAFKANMEKLSPMEQLKAVNLFWNKWPYRLDPENYGQPDYWAAPYEFVKKSGDCEDYAIAKYYTLRGLGWPTEKLRIVVVLETVRNIGHAVLAVYLDGDAYILDNLSSSVLSHSRIRNYVPQFSVNEEYRWAHVRPR